MAVGLITILISLQHNLCQILLQNHVPNVVKDALFKIKCFR